MVKLKRKKLKIAIAESCTGGMLSSAITSISVSSKIFTMGLVTYSNQAKTSILKVPKQIIKKHGAVSAQCCSSMVINLSKISKSNICVSITGIAGPGGGSKKKPVGLVYVGIKKGNKIVKKLDPHSYSTYDLNDGEEFDFKEFRDAEKFYNGVQTFTAVDMKSHVILSEIETLPAHSDVREDRTINNIFIRADIICSSLVDHHGKVAQILKPMIGYIEYED